MKRYHISSESLSHPRKRLVEKHRREHLEATAVSWQAFTAVTILCENEKLLLHAIFI